ncbi:MAG: 50S ribosomal protein L6, partial [Actinobacteria bacterium]|nr:50S ribosomal protein L6 [Actinomycetota bacterium]
PINFAAPAGITFTVESPTDLIVSGVDKQLVGEVVAKIQKLRKADPYKGKGLHLQGARIRRKAGKTGKKA